MNIVYRFHDRSVAHCGESAVCPPDFVSDRRQRPCCRRDVHVLSLPLFTALYGMPARTSYENAVCLFVKHVNCDKTEGRSVQTFIPYERSFSLVL